MNEPMLSKYLNKFTNSFLRPKTNPTFAAIIRGAFQAEITPVPILGIYLIQVMLA